MTKITYKQKLINIITRRITVINTTLLECKECDNFYLLVKKDRLMTYLSRLGNLSANTVAYSKNSLHRHEVINSINLFDKTIIDELYG